MKNSQKGFIVPLLSIIISLLVIIGGVYVYSQKNETVSEPIATVVTNVAAENENSTLSAGITTTEEETKSLTTAQKNLVSDALVKTSFMEVRSRGEEVYDANSNYNTVCSDSKMMSSFSKIEEQTKVKVVCNATATAYAVYATLRNPTAPYTGWCVDGLGYDGESLGLGNAIKCSK